MKWDLSRLFDCHAPEINRFLRRRGHTPETAADLTQDAFARLLTAAPDGPLDNPRAYLHQVARNLSIDFNRRERRFVRADVTEDEFLAIADPRPLQEQQVYDRQRLLVVEKALGELPERARSAFEAHRLGEKTIAEIASDLGLSQTRTWTVIRDAYRHLRRRLNEAE